MRRTAVITGGSSGLGLALGEQLGKAGYAVILLARNPTRLDAAVARLKGLEIGARGMACDVTDENSLRRCCEAIAMQYEGIDYLILSAGCVTPRLFSEYADAESLRKDLDTDLWGTILSVYRLLPLMRRDSRILMISSGFGLMGAAGYTMYCAAKAGVVNFGEALRRELLSQNIHVHVACPGDIDTPMLHEEIAAAPAWMNKKTPRKVMSPGKVASKILKRAESSRDFLIIPSSDVGMLMLLKKLPRATLDRLLNRLFPRP